ADDLAKRTEQQSASVEETAAALEEITTTVKDSSRLAEEAGQLVALTRSSAAVRISLEPAEIALAFSATVDIAPFNFSEALLKSERSLSSEGM
ncbi:hypothetical protein ACC758_38425, partial [Rhizobium ruizarguesonis]